MFLLLYFLNFCFAFAISFYDPKLLTTNPQKKTFSDKVINKDQGPKSPHKIIGNLANVCNKKLFSTILWVTFSRVNAPGNT